MAVTINGTTGILAPDIGIDGTTFVVDEVNNRVGIGNTSPVGSLSVTGNIYSTSDQFQGENAGIFFSGWNDYGAGVYGRNSGNDLVMNAGSGEKLRIDSSGRLLLGSSTTIFDNNFGIGMLQATNKTGYQHVLISGHSDSAANATCLSVGRSRGTQASPAYLQSNDHIARFSATSYNGGNYQTSGAIDFFAEDNHASGDLPGYISFKTVPNGSAGLFERFRIDSAGNVKVLNSTQAYFSLVKTNGGGNGSLTFDGSIFAITSNSTGADMQLGTNSTPRITIKVGGNVGIGVTNPSQKLMVKGVIASEATNSTNNWMAYTHTDNTYRLNYNGAGADEFIITSAGKVGINNDNPNAKLEVKGSGGSTGLTFRGTDSSGNTNFWVQDGGRVGVHYYPFSINQDYSDSATPSNTYFYIHGSSPFIVKNDGFTGIGTNGPQANLHVNSSTGGNASDKAGMLSEAVMKLQPHATNSTNMLFASVNNGNGMGIQVTNGPATADWNVVLSPFGGNVGIGDVDPSQKLNVSGNIMLEGDDQFCYLSNVGTGNAGIYVRGNSQSASNSNHFLRSHSTGSFTWEVTGSEKMRIHPDGRVVMGNSSSSIAAASADLTVKSDNPELHLLAATNYSSYLMMGDVNDYDNGYIEYDNYSVSKGFKFIVGTTKRLDMSTSKVDLSQGMGVEIDGGNSNQPEDTTVYITKTNNNDWALKINVNNSSSTEYGAYVRTTNGASYAFGVNDSTTWRFRVSGNGTIYATNTTVQSISDVRLKENIVDANSQWDDIKALRFRNYKWKEDSGYADGKTYLGLIAQEVETTSPGLVEINAQTKEDKENGVPDPEHKNVKYSIVWMKAMKALQEAMERIETLEERISSLEGS